MSRICWRVLPTALPTEIRQAHAFTVIFLPPGRHNLTPLKKWVEVFYLVRARGPSQHARRRHRGVLNPLVGRLAWERIWQRNKVIRIHFVMSLGHREQELPIAPGNGDREKCATHYGNTARVGAPDRPVLTAKWLFPSRIYSIQEVTAQ